MVKLYYPELLIEHTDIEIDFNGERMCLDNSNRDLGDFILPIFLSRDECERLYPDTKIGTMMFGIYDN